MLFLNETEEKVAVQNSIDGNVVNYINQSALNSLAQSAIHSGYVTCFYYDNEGNIRFQDVWAETHPAQ